MDNQRPQISPLNSPTDTAQFNYDDHWQEIEVELDRVIQKKISYLVE